MALISSTLYIYSEYFLFVDDAGRIGSRQLRLYIDIYIL